MATVTFCLNPQTPLYVFKRLKLFNRRADARLKMPELEKMRFHDAFKDFMKVMDNLKGKEDSTEVRDKIDEACEVLFAAFLIQCQHRYVDVVQGVRIVRSLYTDSTKTDLRSHFRHATSKLAEFINANSWVRTEVLDDSDSEVEIEVDEVAAAKASAESESEYPKLKKRKL